MVGSGLQWLSASQPVTHPLTGMDLVGTSVFCRGSWSLSEVLIFVTSQGCRNSVVGSVSQENLQWAPGIFREPVATSHTNSSCSSGTFYMPVIIPSASSALT